MDNDDNDCHGQGLRLASEESSKVSSVLRPYALPKFDFDEGHLRFDSLVENEVFLGIPCQEDNQWIEDFSRGSSGIEFSSSAADSCSIPRHNNVWSEATSSESVEMLLKSVGQEEMIPGKSIIEESNAGNEFPGLTKQMDPNSRLDNRAVEDRDPSLELPPHQFLGGGSALNQHSESEDGQPGQPKQVDLSADGCSGAVGGKTTLFSTEKNLHVELKCTDDKARGDDTSLNESLNKVHDPSNSMVETERTHSMSSDTGVTRNLLIQDKINDVSDGFADSLPEERSKVGDFGNDNSCVVDDEKFHKIHSETAVIGNHSSVYTSPTVEVMEKSTAETTTVVIKESVNVSAEGKVNMVTAKECNEVACSLEPSQASGLGFVAIAEGMDVTLQPEITHSAPEKSVASEGDSKCQSTEITNYNSHSSSVELDKESDMQSYQGKGGFLEGRTSSSMQVEPTEINGYEGNPVDGHVMPQKSASVESVGGEVVTEGLKDGDDTACFHNDGQKSQDLVSLPVPTGSSHIHVEGSTEQDVVDCNKDRNVSLALDSPSTNTTKYEAVVPCEGKREAGLSSLDKAIEENVESIDRPNLDDFVANEPASDAMLENSYSEAQDRGHFVSSLPLSDATDHGLHNNNEDLKSSQFPSEPLAVHEEKMETGFSSLKHRDVAVKEAPDFLAVKEAPENSASEVQSQDVDQSANMDVEPAVGETCRGHSNYVEQAVGETCRRHPDSHSNSNLRSHGTDSANILEQRESVVDKDHGMPSSGGAGCNQLLSPILWVCGINSSVVGKPIAASAPIVTELLQDRSEKKEGKIESMLDNASDSGGTDGVVNDISLALVPPLVKDATEEERSFTVDILPSASIALGDPNKDCPLVPSSQAREILKHVEKSSSTPGTSQVDPVVVKEVPSGSPQRQNKRASSGGLKVSSEQKARHRSGKSANKNARKGNRAEELTPTSHMEKRDSLSVVLSPAGTGKLMQLDVGSASLSGKKPSGVASLAGSSIPDLNTSVSTPMLFQQPFTDQQQLQLRAQIFVYGSFIQGMAPDEACMVSAFGMTDGGRNIWEPAWRACMGRLHGQKPHISSSETPVQSRSGAKAVDQTNKQGSSQSKVRASSKSTPSPAVSPMIPLSSPLWNISTPSADALPTNNMARGAVLDYQALSPLHAYQTSAVQTLSGQMTSWMSQGHFPVPWLASSQSSPFDTSSHFSAFPTAETVKSTPANELPIVTSIPKYASPVTVGHGGNCSGIPGASSVHDSKKVAISHAPHSAEPKSRKRKKNPATQDAGQITIILGQTESVSAPVANSHDSNEGPAQEDLNVTSSLARNQAGFLRPSAANIEFSTSISIPNPSNIAVESNPDKSHVAISSIPSIDHHKSAGSLEKRALGSEEIAKVEETKLQAEATAVLAAEAVSNCQALWSQLDKQKNSGLVSNIEAKLASAAAAIAAASAVAKAAAAAAKIASNAAVQAKLMADEVLNSNKSLVPLHSDVILAAREASRRRIEAASAASRHAENLDAVVKAAELAAEAVSQAGKIVALNDPLPLSTLVEAGPESYWKASELLSCQGVKSNHVSRKIPNKISLEEVPDVNMDLSERPPNKEIHTTVDNPPPHPRTTSRKLTNKHIMGDRTLASVTVAEKEVRGPKIRGWRASDLNKATALVPVVDGSISTASETMDDTVNDNNIRENCLVEVFKDNGDFAGAWFSANVLSMKDGKALVCYTGLESDEGNLKEWVSLEAGGESSPTIRLAHTITNINLEGGTRKRRRAAVRDYTWSLGDRVDAWMGNCWREGVIIEKSEKDETTLSVNFPAQGKTSVTKAWDLRPTLLWKDGMWVECSSSGQDYSSQGDTPQEKRTKLGSPIESKGSTKNESKPENHRTMRSGLQKEGSKVIFGVPKPGKRRKFMEVSKHYVSDRRGKNSAPTESDKFGKYLVPEGSGARGWKNNSKPDSKEKHAAESKTRGFKAGKPPTVSSRTLPQKENSMIPSTSSSRGGAMLTDNSAKNITGRNERESGQQTLNEFLSSSNNEEGAAHPTQLSSQVPVSNPLRKIATSHAKSERLRKGKLAPAVGKLAEVEEKEQSVSDLVEPRRSNRRIQPTSRLLEGLQSSLVISKIPSVSHDKKLQKPKQGSG